ncbi:histone deacetylase complex protein [Coprinopsis sp. MPI-PUGE-AT-0042]|nr:histone deacetylase complex protein [Coprinopsis sp. MPI-PUGE-AT-0042]
MDSEPERKIAFIVSQELAKISSLLPSNKDRSFLVHSLIHSLGLLKLPGVRDLAVYHSKDYLDFVLDKANEGKHNAEFGLQDDYIQLVAGATLTACDALKQNVSDISICWDGGRHHAHKSRASGFCYVADCILAILALKQIRKPKVMYIDLDLHFSDAVSEAFLSSSSQTLVLSIHHSAPGFFPVSRLYDPFTLSIPLKQGASNKTYARIWPTVERVVEAFSPDYVVVQCGVDALAGDPWATFNWSIGGGDGSLGWCIDRILSTWPGKKLLLGGGGYNSPNVARAWAYLTSIVAGSPLELDTHIPDHSGFPMYGPSFTLDVPPGMMQDQNTEEYLTSIEASFNDITNDIRSRLT